MLSSLYVVAVFNYATITIPFIFYPPIFIILGLFTINPSNLVVQ